MGGTFVLKGDVLIANDGLKRTASLTKGPFQAPAEVGCRQNATVRQARDEAVRRLGRVAERLEVTGDQIHEGVPTALIFVRLGQFGEAERVGEPRAGGKLVGKTRERVCASQSVGEPLANEEQHIAPLNLL